MPSRTEIIDLLVEKYGVERDLVKPDATFSELGLDSLAVAELVFDIEDLLGIEIEADDVDFTTLGEALDTVQRYVDPDGD